MPEPELLSLLHRAPPEPARAASWEHSTLRLKSGDVAVAQSLGDPAQRHACLVLYNGADPGRRFVIEGTRLVVGRSPDCDAHVDDPGISRRHAEVQAAGDGFELRDLGSANGTLLNGKRIDMPMPLKDGDLVRLGEVVLKFYDKHSLDALLHDRIYRMATVDDGTQVFSKRYVLEALDREVRRAQRSGQPLSLMCLDLDHFKSVNDRWGHAAGDVVLRQAAATVRACVRETDVVGRLGGEEFLVLLPDTALSAAVEAAERVRQTLAGQDIRLAVTDARASRTVFHRQTASIGVTQLEARMAGADELLAAADALMYAAKREGRNRVQALALGAGAGAGRRPPGA